MKLSRLPFLFLFLSSACAKDRDNDGGSNLPKDSGVEDMGVADTGVDLGFEARAVATDIATAQCQFFSRCVPEYYDANAIDQATCVTDTTDALVESFEDLAPLFQAGRVVYNESQKNGCVSALGSADCILDLPDGNPCDQIFTGTQQANDPCFFGAECGQNLYCNRAQGAGTCGACAQAPAKGADCDPFTPCVDGARCLDIGQAAPDYVCIPIDAQQGGQCLTIETGLCQGRLSCVGDQTNGFTCQPPGGSGAQCDNDPNSFALAECNLSAGFGCDGAMCADASWSDLSGSCNDTTQLCREGYCSAGSCTGFPGAGQSCQQSGACGEDAFCDGTNCRPLIADGQACNFSYECAGLSACLGAGVNRPGTCGLLEWELCN
jgi:hypothetical protein